MKNSLLLLICIFMSSDSIVQGQHAVPFVMDTRIDSIWRWNHNTGVDEKWILNPSKYKNGSLAIHKYVSINSVLLTKRNKINLLTHVIYPDDSLVFFY